jgi:hypothetical protein
VLREVAEYPNSFTPLGAGEERIETERYTLCMGHGRSWNTVQRQRMRAGEVDEVLEEVRARLRDRGRTSTQWEVGSSAEPSDLVEQLLARGLVRDSEPFAIALVLRSPPPVPPPGVVARRVETYEELERATWVQWEAFELPEERRAEARAAMRERFRDSSTIMHAAWVGGELVGAGRCAPTEHGLLLYGGATLPSARGRGAYRALLHARWREAVERGTPGLITQGGAMSRPILERAGFEAIGRVDMLLDRFGEPS